MSRLIPSLSDLAHFSGEQGPADNLDTDRSQLRNELTRAGIDAPKFEDWLVGRLRHYFDLKHVEALFVEPAEEVAWLRRLQTVLQQAAQLTAYGAAPPRAHSALNAVSLRGDIDLHALRDRLQADLVTFDVLVDLATRRMKSTPGRPGRKENIIYKALLTDVTAQLQALGLTKKAAANTLALTVLSLEGIEGPDPAQDKPEKAASRASKRRGQK